MRFYEVRGLRRREMKATERPWKGFQVRAVSVVADPVRRARKNPTARLAR